MGSPENAEKGGDPPYFEAVTTVLSCCLHEDAQTRQFAESRKKLLEAVEEYPLVLCEVLKNTNEALAEKHLASIFLRGYLDDIVQGKRSYHALQRKGIPKKLVNCCIELISTNFHHIKLMLAKCLSCLALLDMWNYLSSKLAIMLKSNDEFMVYNAAFVLKDLLTERNMSTIKHLKVSPVFFQILMDVFNRENIYAEVRALTVPTAFLIVRFSVPEMGHRFLIECLTKMGESFEKALREPYSHQADFQFKCEIVDCLLEINKYYERQSGFVFTMCLPAIGQLMPMCCETYKAVVKRMIPYPKDDNEYDYEEPKNFNDLIVSLLIFTRRTIDQMYIDILLDDLDNFLYCLVIFMSSNSEAMEKEMFMDESDKYHTPLTRNLSAYNIVYVLEKIQHRRRKGKQVFYKSLHNVITKLNQEMELIEDLEQRSYFTYRVTESIMYTLGITADIFLKDDEVHLPLECFIEHLIKVVERQNHPILNGRLIWLGAKYSLQLSPRVLDLHLRQITNNLNDEESMYLFNPSVDALKIHLKLSHKQNDHNKMVVSTHSKQIIYSLLSHHQKLSTEDRIPWLGAFAYCVQVYPREMALHINLLQDIMLNTLYADSANMLIAKEISFLVTKLASHPNQDRLYPKFLAFMLSITQSLVPANSQQRYGTPDKAMDLINVFLIHCTQPVPDVFISRVFQVATTILGGDLKDFDYVDESAGNILITLIVKYSHEMVKMEHDGNSRSIANIVPTLIERIMSPESPMPGHVMAKLIIVSIFHFPDLLKPHLETILKNVITTRVQDFGKIRSTWLIFLFLTMLEPHDTINYLSILPGLTGGSALQSMLRLWMPNDVYSVDKIERQIMCVAIRNILTHCMAHDQDGAKIKEISVPMELDGVESAMTGLEFLYYLMISFALYEIKLRALKTVSEPPTSEDDGLEFEELMMKKNDEDNDALYKNHPFNVDILRTVADCLNTKTGVYFDVCKKYMQEEDKFQLGGHGCFVPDDLDYDEME